MSVKLSRRGAAAAVPDGVADPPDVVVAAVSPPTDELEDTC
jgi:hypothetical protein